MKALRNSIVPVAMILLATGCASGSPFMQSFDGRAGSRNTSQHRRAATLELENNSWSNVVVYLVHLGTRTRLATVTSMTRSSIRLSRQHLNRTNGVIRVMVRPLGSRDAFTTGPIILRGGDAVSMHVGNHLPTSSYFVVARR